MVNGIRNELLAGTCLPLYKHSRLCWSDLLEELEYLVNPVIPANNILKGISSLEFFLQIFYQRDIPEYLDPSNDPVILIPEQGSVNAEH